MSEQKIKPSILKKRFDEEITPLIKKIVEEEALTGVVSNEIVVDYWAYLNIKSEVPVIFKGSKEEGTINTSFNVEINIAIEEGEEEI